MALCCYDCALYHAHSCSRILFPSSIGAPGGAVPTDVDESGKFGDDEDDAVAAAIAASLAPGALPDGQPPYPGGLLTAAQLAGMARQTGQSASNTDVCGIAAAIAASLADLQTADPAPAEQHEHNPHVVAPAIWDDSSGTGTDIPGSSSVHTVHLRTLSEARAEQSNLAAADVASRASLTPAERSDALHLHRISSDAALLATSADVVVRIYDFIAQATDSLQHQQQQYDDQCTPDNAAALDVLTQRSPPLRLPVHRLPLRRRARPYYLKDPASPSRLTRLVLEWPICPSPLERREPSAPTLWPPTRAPAAQGRYLPIEVMSTRCAKRFISTASCSAVPLRMLTTTMTMNQCNRQTMPSLPLSRAFPATDLR